MTVYSETMLGQSGRFGLNDFTSTGCSQKHFDPEVDDPDDFIRPDRINSIGWVMTELRPETKVRKVFDTTN